MRDDRVEVFKETDDDWYPSYRLAGFSPVSDEKRMLVLVAFCGNISPPNERKFHRVSVWGADDCGMEYDCERAGECWTMFVRVIKMEKVNRDELKKMGFVSA